MKPLILLTNDFTTESLISPISSLIRKARFGMPANSANSQSGKPATKIKRRIVILLSILSEAGVENGSAVPT
jgi:hypothetical protein